MNFQHEIDGRVASTELRGLIEAMKEGLFITFEYEGIQVHRSGNSVGVSPSGPPQDMVGGRLLMDSANLEETAEWIEAKVDLYGDN
jgi:hypothetical protein